MIQAYTYLADIHKPSHQILVAESIDSMLSLIPCSVFHNPDDDVRHCIYDRTLETV